MAKDFKLPSPLELLRAEVSLPQKSSSVAYASRKSTKRLAKSKDPAYKKFTTYIPSTLHRTVKCKLLNEGKELSALVESLLLDWSVKE